MKFKILSILLLLGLSQKSIAAGACLQLEGVNLGCVSSIDHKCFRNLSVNKEIECKYVGEPNTSYRVEGPISFQCSSYSNVTVCNKNTGNGDQKGESCVTHSVCNEYIKATCREECISCYDNIVTEKIGTSKGCLICTREPCSDEKERLVQSTCPYYNSLGMPLGPDQKCTTPTRCPDTAIPEHGHPPLTVTVIRPNCEKPKLPEHPKKDPPLPKMCPWKNDRRSATGCEPIEPDNKND